MFGKQKQYKKIFFFICVSSSSHIQLMEVLELVKCAKNAAGGIRKGISEMAESEKTTLLSSRRLRLRRTYGPPLTPVLDSLVGRRETSGLFF